MASELIQGADGDVVLAGSGAAMRHSDAVDAVCALLAEQDPMDIMYGGNPREYEPEALSIVERMESAASGLDLSSVLAIVHEEFCRWFNRELAGPPERLSGIASEVLRIWDGQSAAPQRVTRAEVRGAEEHPE